MKHIFIILLASLVLVGCQSKTASKEETQAQAQVQAQPVKIADYLWEVTVDNYCDSIPNFLIDRVGVEFNCSSVRNGNYYGRNLDFFISETAEVIVHTPAREGRHASVGIASVNQRTDADFEKGLTPEDFYILPWGMYDGINDAGLFCNINVTPYADGGDNPGTNPGMPDIYNPFLIRALLDNCGSVDEAVDFINGHNVIGKEMGGFNLHFMIGDPEKTVVVEFINNEAVVKEQNIMTNFYVNLLPEFTPAADGIERYNILLENYAEGGESMEGMRNLLKRVRFSQAYDPEMKPFWKSEFAIEGYTTSDAPVELVLADPSVQKSLADFKHYKETGEYEPEMKLWYTEHNSTYDIQNRKLWVTVHEDYDNYYEFTLEQ